MSFVEDQLGDVIFRREPAERELSTLWNRTMDKPSEAGHGGPVREDASDVLARRVAYALEDWASSGELAADFSGRLIKEIRVHFITNAEGHIH